MDWGNVLQNAAATVTLAALFLFYMERSEKQRAENAAKLEGERREHESTIYNMLANTMKKMVDDITASNERVIKFIEEHEKASDVRIKGLANTQDIIKKLDEMAISGKTIKRKPQ